MTSAFTHVLAGLLTVSPREMTPTEWGTAQDLTLGIFMGTTIFFALMIMFWLRSGHERAHRTNAMRLMREKERTFRRSEELEAQLPPPQPGESKPQ